MGLVDQYAGQLRALLPRGKAWGDDPNSFMGKLLLAIAEELARIHTRGKNLVEELDPRTTDELLTDFERVLGLPEDCITLEQTEEQRRDAVVAKMIAQGGQSPQYFIDLAAAMGFTITITEYRPFRVGYSSAGDELTDEEWAFTWKVNGAADVVHYAVAGSPAGTLLAWTDNELLPCTFGKLKPAHTNLIFEE